MGAGSGSDRDGDSGDESPRKLSANAPEFCCSQLSADAAVFDPTMLSASAQAFKPASLRTTLKANAELFTPGKTKTKLTCGAQLFVPNAAPQQALQVQKTKTKLASCFPWRDTSLSLAADSASTL